MITKKKECNGCQQERYIYKNVTIDGVRLKLCKDCAFRQDLKVQPTKVGVLIGFAVLFTVCDEW